MHIEHISRRILSVLGLLLLLTGCGATKSYTATEQLLMSDAVDATVAKLDFEPLTAKKVYLDTTFLKTQKSPLLIDSDYVISSLRQQMMAAGVQLVENREESDLIAEARMGALGLDGHNVTYGLPASNVLSTATSAFASAPVLPTIPEISIARREAKSGAAKLAVFAYERETREPFWQSGIARSSSNARETWFLGVGPFQSGTIYNGTRFAGDKLASTDLGLAPKRNKPISEAEFRGSDKFAAYSKGRVYSSYALSDADEGESHVKLAQASKAEAKN